MLDFFPPNTIRSSDNQQQQANMAFSIYGIQITPTLSLSLNVNLAWPKFDLPLTADRYFVSFHTEQLDDDWIIQQANRVYPKPIMLVNDCKFVKNPQWPDNIIFIRWITVHQQLEYLANFYGVCYEPLLPKYHLSSLSFRHSQYKKFVSAWLIKNVDPTKLMLTWHGHVTHDSHIHGHPNWATWLDDLDMPPGQLTCINWDDQFSLLKNEPLYNANWHCPPYTEALVNLTNETFNYSLSFKDNQSYTYLSPYITEKTYKPLLAGRPFVAVGQYQTLKTLTELGFDTNFGWISDYDHDSGDLTRIQKIFQTLDQIQSQNIKHLYEGSLDAVKHNVHHITSGNLSHCCDTLNQKNLKQIVDFLS